MSARSRPILSPERTLGSVIQLFTPSPEYTDEHNAWLRALAVHDSRTAVHREALLPAGMGRKLARAFRRGPRQRVLGTRAEIRQSEARELLPARGLRPGWLLAHLQIAARFSSRRQSAGGGRHHGFGRAAAREPERPGPGIRRIPASSWWSIARRCSSSVPTTRFTAAPTSRRRPTSPAPARSSRTTSRSPSSRRRESRTTWPSSTSTPSR